MSIYDLRNKNYEYAFIRSIIMEIMMRRPQEIEGLFMEELDENIEFMRKYGSKYLSYGGGKKLTLLQKAETLSERAPDAKEGDCLERERLFNIYHDILPKTKREALDNVDLGPDKPHMGFYEYMSTYQDVERTANKMSYRNGKSLGPDGIISYENYIEKAFCLKKGLWETETVKKAVKKAYRRLSEYVCGKPEGEGRTVSIDAVIASAITGFNRFVPETASWTTRMFEIYVHDEERQINDVQIFPFLLFSGISKWRTGFDNGREEFIEMCGIASEAVLMVIKAYILYFLFKHLGEVRYADKLFKSAISLPGQFDNSEILSEEDMRFIYRDISSIDYNEMMMCCYFASALEINKAEQIKKDTELMALSAGDSPSLMKELFEAKKEITRLKNRNAELEEEVQKRKNDEARIKQEAWEKTNAETRIKELNRESIEAERQHRKELKEKDAEIESLRAKVEQLDDIIAKNQEADEEAEAVCEEHVDHEKMFYFICDDEGISKRLIKEFPNSKCSMDYDYTGANCRNFDAAVIITQRLGHSTLDKYEDLLKKNNIPLEYIHVIGIRHIKMMLAQRGYGR